MKWRGKPLLAHKRQNGWLCFELTCATLTKSTDQSKALIFAASFLALLVLGTIYVQNRQTDLIWQQEQTLRENAREQAAAAVYDLGELPTLSVVALG